MNNLNNPVPTKQEIKKAREALWRQGDLYWKLTTSQKQMYDFFHGKTEKIIILTCSRRLGKSVLALTLAFEQCIKHPNSVVKYILPQQGWARKIIHREVLPIVIKDCPKDLLPVFKTQDNVYEFSNGSQIQLAGTDNNNYEKLRGGNSHLAIIDEAGFGSDINHVLDSILIPTTLHTKGKILITSTPATDPNHEFNTLMDIAGSEGRLMIKTIFDGLEDSKNDPEPLITLEKIHDIIINTAGGVDSDKFRTEFLCQRINDSDAAVIPEFTRNEKDIVVPWPMPPFCDKYVAMDIGFVDYTVALFAYYDFVNAVLVVQDELVMSGKELTTEKLAQAIQRKEIQNWTDKITGETDKPFIRVCDNNLIMINDLARTHNVYFRATDKMDKAGALNKVRMMMDNNQIIINEKCSVLISHLKFATWDKTKKGYKRTEKHGHFDAVDALVYLVRNISETHNPFPKGYKYQGLNSGNTYMRDKDGEELTDFQQKFKDQFGVKSSFKKKA